MSLDKSAEKRADLDRQIVRVEAQEDEFSEARQRYEGSLEQFREQFRAVGRVRELSLGERTHSGDNGAPQELEARQALVRQVDRYVEEAAEEVEQLRRRVRQSFDDELDTLAAERNGLPWE